MRPATSLIGASSGSAPDAKLHRLVGDTGDLAIDERLCERRIGREVEVGEQHEAGAEQGEFLLPRLLDLDHHVGAFPYRGRGRHDLGARPAVLLVCKV